MSMYEERLKTVLSYNLQPNLPLQFVTEFFTNTFAPETLNDLSRPEAQWKVMSEKYIKNLQSFIPLSLWFNPVLVAAAYLDNTRREIAGLSETIAGHPWFLFVDSGLNPLELERVSAYLSQAIAQFYKSTTEMKEPEPR